MFVSSSLKYDHNVKLDGSHFYEILWMSFDDVHRIDWTPLCLEIVLDGFEQKLNALKSNIRNLSVNTVRYNINQVLKLHLEWVLFNLHLFIVIHKNLCEDSLRSLNDDEEINQVFDEQIEKMKKVLSVNKQNLRIRDLANKISPGAESNQNLMDRIFILASTWPSSEVNEINRSLRVYAMFRDIFGYNSS